MKTKNVFFFVIAAIVAMVSYLFMTDSKTVLTYYDVKRKIKRRFENTKVQKVIFADLDSLEKEMHNIDIEELHNGGYKYVIVSIDYSGNVIGNIDMIKASDIDPEVEIMLGDEGIIVVNR